MTSAASVLVITPTLGTRPGLLAEATASLRDQDVRIRQVLVAPSEVPLALPPGATRVADVGRGLSAAVNTGLAALEGEDYVYWLNDDDRVRPGGLDHLVARLSERPGAPVALGAVELVDLGGRHLLTLGGGPRSALLLAWGPGTMAMPGVLLRASALRRLGGLDEGLEHAADLDLVLRLRAEGRPVTSRRVVAQFRWHPGSLTVVNPRPSLREAEDVRLRHHRGRSSRRAALYRAWRPIAGTATLVAKRVVTARARGPGSTTPDG